MLEAEGNIKAAVERERESVAIREKLVERSPDDVARARRDLAIARYVLAVTLEKAGDQPAAQKEIALAKTALGELLTADPTNNRLKNELKMVDDVMLRVAKDE
jgi:hypothetical protein